MAAVAVAVRKDSGSGMKAELSPRPGVSECALPRRLSSAMQEAMSTSFRPSLHPCLTLFLGKARRF
ncbi:hypothetical protein PAL_GLEAN10020264 [Pteropus alecto]|uniref:Uncharacterized protein n=1 Tax=Pteropus alecto TaxID=9402 RepID=L5KSZ8_PTEAL|nr:hypothetical protein PAL_GLEAN10020264 [Pteropus alecto]